jgi:hypothetical protein
VLAWLITFFGEPFVVSKADSSSFLAGRFTPLGAHICAVHKLATEMSSTAMSPKKM